MKRQVQAWGRRLLNELSRTVLLCLAVLFVIHAVLQWGRKRKRKPTENDHD